MQLPDIKSPIWFFNTTLIFFLIITLRYFLVTGTFFLIFYKLSYKKWKDRKLNSRKYTPNQFRKEIIWSLATSSIFSIAGTITVILWQNGYTNMYSDISTYGLWYLPVSILIFMLLHETYYYWLHRWMHIPKIFRIVHKVHHESNIASPFTAFSFHPLEGLAQAIFLPIMVLILPMHLYAIITVLVIMTLSSVINHLDIEVYPKYFYRHPLGKWLIGATHHSLHHKQFKYNYGLYFTFWDKIKRTESPMYESLFESTTQEIKGDV